MNKDDYAKLIEIFTKYRRVPIFNDALRSQEIAEMVASALYLLNLQNNQEPIEVMIDSSGGNHFQALTIIGAIETIQAPVCGVVTGKACSAAALVLLACKKRLAYPLATISFHFGQKELENYEIVLLLKDPVGFAQQLKRHYQELISWVCLRAGLKKGKVFQLMANEVDLTPAMALRMRIIGEIINSA